VLLSQGFGDGLAGRLDWRKVSEVFRLGAVFILIIEGTEVLLGW
jgi:hypothetical protein